MPSRGQLTPRQEQVMELLARGLTNKEIAGELGIGPEGVKAHVSRLLLRFGARNRVALVSAIKADEPRGRVLGGAASSLDGIRRGLTPNGGAGPQLTDLQAYGRRVSETMRSVGGYASDDALARLGALRESLGAIELAIELAAVLPHGTVDRPLLEAIRSRSTAALGAVVDLDRLLRAEAHRSGTATPKRSARAARAAERPVNGSAARAGSSRSRR